MSWHAAGCSSLSTDWVAATDIILLDLLACFYPTHATYTLHASLQKCAPLLSSQAPHSTKTKHTSCLAFSLKRKTGGEMTGALRQHQCSWVCTAAIRQSELLLISWHLSHFKPVSCGPCEMEQSALAENCTSQFWILDSGRLLSSLTSLNGIGLGDQLDKASWLYGPGLMPKLTFFFCLHEY